MSYVKLIARPDTWFKVGKEVYDADSVPDDPCRIDVGQWGRWQRIGNVLASGVHVLPSEIEPSPEIWDTKLCSVGDFIVEIVEERV